MPGFWELNEDLRAGVFLCIELFDGLNESTIESRNKALVLEAFDTLWSKALGYFTLTYQSICPRLSRCTIRYLLPACALDRLHHAHLNSIAKKLAL